MIYSNRKLYLHEKAAGFYSIDDKLFNFEV